MVAEHCSVDQEDREKKMYLMFQVLLKDPLHSGQVTSLSGNVSY